MEDTDWDWRNLMNMIQAMQRIVRIGFIFERYPGIVLALAVFVPACLAQPETFSRSDIKVLGPIDYGQTSAPARLEVRPRYSGYSFNAKPGDNIDVTIEGQGRLQGFLTNSRYQKLAGRFGRLHLCVRSGVGAGNLLHSRDGGGP